MATATGSKDIDIAGTAARLAALGPHDALGAMLAEQMAAVHAAALRALERRRDAAEARADEAERKARVREREQREEEREAALMGLAPPRRRRASARANGRDDGTACAADELPAGLCIPDPMSD